MVEETRSEPTIIFDPVTGQVINVETGEVVEDHPIDMHVERKMFTASEWMERSRTSNIKMFSVHDSGLHTRVDVVPVLVEARKFNRTSLAAKAIKLRELNRRTRVGRDDRKLVELLSTIWRVCKTLNLPEEVIETASMVARKARNIINLYRSQVPTVAAACIVMACRAHNIPLSANDVMKVLGINRKQLFDMIRLMEFHNIAKFRHQDPRLFVERVVNSLGLPPEVAVLANMIVDALKRKHATEGKSPASVACAAVYVASIILDRKVTQRTVAEVLGLSEATVRYRYRDIVDRLTIEVML